LFEFERPRGGERALLVHINFPHQPDQDDLAEFVELVHSADVDNVDLIIGTRQQATAKTFVGKGKLEEIAAQVESQQIDVVLFNHALSPSQERNLETAPSPSVRNHLKASCRLSWRNSGTFRPGWYVAGLIWNGKRVVLDCVDPEKPSSKPIAACWLNASSI
jgi:hypothetical protein